MKIVHAADLHLDSPLRGLPPYEGAPVEEVRSATRRALTSLVDLCLEEQANLLLIAGDLYDGDFKDFSTALFFTAEMARLREVGTQVVWIRGNHDAANRMTKHLRNLPHVFELDSERPQTKVFEDIGVAVHGQGYLSREVRDNLVLDYPAPLVGLFNIGLLHTALDGREGHAPYAPCTVAHLTARGYDYWALGHVHQREVVSEQPLIVFPGNLQGRHIRETGPKGCTLLSLKEGRIEEQVHRVLDHVRWAVCAVDLSDATHVDDVLELAEQELRVARDNAEGRIVATRVRLQGRTPSHGAVCQAQDRILAELRARSLDVGDVYLQGLEFFTQGPRSEAQREARKDALGELFASMDELLVDEEAARELWDSLLRPLGAVPSELLRHEDFGPRKVIDEARRLLEGRLLSGSEEP